MGMTPRDWGLSSAAAALFLDQATKFLLLYVFDFRSMSPGEAVPLLQFFNFVITWKYYVSYVLFLATRNI
jgi:hypothetical protein